MGKACDMTLIDRLTRLTGRLAKSAGQGLFWGALLLMGQSGAAWSQSLDCKQVNIETLNPLNFGMLRIKRGHSGWMVLDVSGGTTLSPGLAVARSWQPSPGQVRLTAPSASTVLLSLVVDGGWNSKAGRTDATPLKLVSVVMAKGIQPLKKMGEYWELQLGPHDSGVNNAVLSVGGELLLGKTEQVWDLTTALRVSCISIRPS